MLILLVIVPTFIVMCGPLVVRRFASLERIAANNEVAGFKFATLGVIFAVLLGLAVIAAWEKFSGAHEAATIEASSLASTYRLAGAFSTEAQQPLKAALTRYVRSAIEDDWPAMERGTQSPETLDALNDLYETALALPADTPRGSVVLEEIVDQLDQVTESRRQRITLAEGIVPSVMWLVLITGALTTIGFTYFFGLDNIRAQMLMTGMLALLIFIALFVAASVDHPFTGTVRIPPDALERVLEDFGGPAPPLG